MDTISMVYVRNKTGKIDREGSFENYIGVHDFSY